MQLVRELEAGALTWTRSGASTAWARVRPFAIAQKIRQRSLGRIIRVEKPEERNEKRQLKRRVRALEQALADTNIDLALERQYTKLACARAGIQDVAEFKKKAAGQLPTER